MGIIFLIVQIGINIKYISLENLLIKMDKISKNFLIFTFFILFLQ
jgi:hypothetical protein